jgi:hypothetical protein
MRRVEIILVVLYSIPPHASDIAVGHGFGPARSSGNRGDRAHTSFFCRFHKDGDGLIYADTGSSPPMASFSPKITLR